MPELPEVETIKNGLSPVMDGATINRVTLNRDGLRFPFPPRFVDQLEGQTIGRLRRRAKYLIVPLGSGVNMLAHLGMSGHFRIDSPPATGCRGADESTHDQRHDHVRIEVLRPGAGRTTIIYNDPRRFGYMALFRREEQCRHLTSLGPEPLGNQFSAQHLANRFRGRRTPIKSALLDQSNIAGLGNIYVCEALFVAGIAPWQQAGELVSPDGAPVGSLELLASAIVDVLHRAIEAGGSTLRDFRRADGAPGYFQHRFAVYGREGAPCDKVSCTETVQRMVQSGRSSFFCPACQSPTN